MGLAGMAVITEQHQTDRIRCPGVIFTRPEPGGPRREKLAAEGSRERPGALRHGVDQLTDLGEPGAQLRRRRPRSASSSPAAWRASRRQLVTAAVGRVDVALQAERRRPGLRHRERTRREPVAAGEVRVRATQAAVGELHGSEQRLLQLVGLVLVEQLVGRAERGECARQVVDRIGHGIEQIAARIGRGVRHQAAARRSRSHSVVCAIPSRTPICASQPSMRFALLDVGPAPHHVDGEGRQVRELEGLGVAAADLPDDPRDLATVSSSEAEMLKSSLQRLRRSHRGHHAVGDVVDVRQRARLLARAEDLQRVLTGRGTCG